MIKHTIRATLFLLAAAGVAQAGGSPGTLGVGTEYTLASFGGAGGGQGIGGISLNYDAGDFHVGGMLGMSDGGGADDTAFGVAGRFYYHLHSTTAADFSVGGNLGLLSVDVGNDSASLLVLEPGFQIRAFVTPNVALSFTGGLTIGMVDADGFALTSQPTGTAGVHYYFF